MAKLLISTPARGSYTQVQYLVPRFQQVFEDVMVWAGNDPPPDAENVSHLLRIAPIENLCGPATDKQISEYPNAITYAWAGIDSAMVPHAYASASSNFDFFVAMSSMAAAAYRNVLLDFGGAVPKKTFKSVYETRVIRPGVDREHFYPLSGFARHYSRAEIREALFGDKVNNQAFLIFCEYWSALTPPAAMVVAKRLHKLLDRQIVLYLSPHPDIRPRDIHALAAGSGLQLGSDLFLAGDEATDPTRLNLIYNASDIYLCLDPRSSWPFKLTNAMAAGCVVAAPDDHVWLECIDRERGIELPAELLVEDLGSAEGYVRTVLPGVSADLIAAAFMDDSYKKIRENAIIWSSDAQASCATEWLRLFGMA